MKYKYDVIAIHFTTDCNLSCPMCYRPKKFKELDCKFYFDLVPYLSKLAPQLALGGGEPFLFPGFIRRLGEECKKHNLILNITTNGTLPIGDFLKDVTMVSVSFDKYKVKTAGDLARYEKFVKDLKQYTKVGCNLLVDDEMFNKRGYFNWLVDYLFNHIKVERIFALYPKNWKAPDILKHRAEYLLATIKYKHFYVDDLTNKILKENSYTNWKHSCHFGKSIVSIDENKNVLGCSFDTKPILKLKEPKDILKLKTLKVKERYKCPYLNTIE
jgi:MoaA/NifB/PqqE/SkfB family radical SAM enzyme